MKQRCSAQDLLRMYTRYAERRALESRTHGCSTTPELAESRKLVFLIKGKGAYSRLKYESWQLTEFSVYRKPKAQRQNPYFGGNGCSAAGSG